VNYEASIILYFEISFRVLLNCFKKVIQQNKHLIFLSARDIRRELVKKIIFIDGCATFGAATYILWFRALRLTIPPLELALWLTILSLEIELWFTMPPLELLCGSQSRP
jgi:hypothetical protein